MSCKNLFSRGLLRIGYLWIFLFFSSLYSQGPTDILKISKLSGISVPNPAPPSPIVLPATCPTATYSLAVEITNQSTYTINFGNAATALNVNVVLNGPNRTDNGGAAGLNQALTGSLAGGATTTITFNNIDLDTPGANTFTVSLTGNAITGTAITGVAEAAPNLDDNYAAAAITTNPIPTTATLNSSAGTSVCQGDLVTISSGGGSTYHFFLNGAPLTVNPTNDASFSLTTLSNGDVISVRVVDVSGCISTNSKTFTVNQTPNSGGGGTLIDMEANTPGEVEISTEFQINRIEFSGNSGAVNEKYYASVNGVLLAAYTTSALNETPSTLAAGLAPIIQANANISTAIANIGPGGAGTIEVTSNAKGMSYPVEVSKSTSASSTIGVSLIQAGTTFTICEIATKIKATGPAITSSYSFTLGGSPIAITDGTSITTLTPPFATPIMLEVTGFTVDGCSSKKTVNIAVNSITSVGAIGNDQTICAGGNPGVISSLASATGSGAITYSWFAFPFGASDWAELSPKVTTASYDPPALTVSTTFKRRAISTLNNKVCFEESSVVTITVAPALNGGTISDPGGQSICVGGDPDNMTITGDTPAASDIFYQWEKSTTASTTGFTAIAGITSPSYDPPLGLTETTWFRRAIIRRSGLTELCREYSTVKPVIVNVVDAGSISSSIEICQSQPTVIGSLGDAIGNGGVSPVTYLWQRYNAGAWAPASTVSGSNSASNYSIPSSIYNAAGTYQFRRDAVVGTCSVTTNVVTVTVYAPLVAGVASATLNQMVICAGGDPGNLTTTGGSTGAAAGISFIWQTSPNNASPWTDIPGTNSEEYNPPGGSQATDMYYRRVVIRSNSSGEELCRAESTSILIDINTITAGTINNPQTTVCSGDTPLQITSAVGATVDLGATLSYQWVSRTKTLGVWGAWANAPGGSTSATYQPVALTADTQFARGVISTEGGETCSVSSTIETILVNPANNLAISTSSQTICLGAVPSPLSFIGASTGAGYTNQWLESDDDILYTPIVGAFGTAYSPGVLTSTKYYRLQTTYTNGPTSCTTTSTAGPGTIVVTVDSAAPTSPDITPSTGTVSNTFQEVKINISGTPAVGDKYYITINGTTYFYTVLPGLTSISNVAAGLAPVVLADGNIGSAVANGPDGAGTIVLTANTAGTVYTVKTSSSFGAGAVIGSQITKGSKLITVCVGDLGVATLTATSTVLAGTPTYAFTLNGGNIVDTPDGTITLPGGMVDNAIIIAKSTSNTCATDFAVNVIVNRVTSGIIEAPDSICSGDDPSGFTSLSPATIPAGASIVYEWWVKRSDGSGGYTNTGATGASYDSPALIVSSTFKRVAKSILNGLECTVDSNEIEITVLPDLVAGVASITTNQTSICLGGDPAELSVINGGTPRTAAGPGISFMWQTSLNDLAWTDTGITTENYNPAAGSQSTDLFYRRVVIRRDGLGVELCRANSTSQKINLNSVQAGTVSTSVTAVCNGDTPPLILNATNALPDPGGATLTYQWVIRTRPLAGVWGAWSNAPGGSTSQTYQPGPLTLDTQFVRGVTSLDGTLSCSTSSTAVTILVNPAISTAVSTSSQTICLGSVPSPLTFVGATTGAGYTNQWLESDDNISFTAIPGAFGTSYAPDAPTTNKYYKLQTTYTNGPYTCTVTSTGQPGTIEVTVDSAAPKSPDIIASTGTVTNSLQVTSISLSGTPNVGDKYYVILNGVILTPETAVGGDTALSIAQRLDDTIQADAAIGTAVATSIDATSASISVTANTAGSVFTVRTSTSFGAGLSMGTQINTGSKLITICVDDLGVATLTATSTVLAGTPTYTFTINSITEPDAPDGTLTLPAGMVDNVLVVAKATSNTCATDFAVNVIVNRVTAGTISSSASICPGGDPDGFTGTVATAPSGASISYQWWVYNGTAWNNTGATGPTYDQGSLAVSSTFKRIAFSDLNGQVCSVESNQISITVAAALVGGVASITTNQTSICLGGDPAEISVIDGTVSRTAAGPGISFLWQTSPNGLAPWTDTAVTTENYNPIAGSQVTDLYYRRVVIRRNSGGVELCRDESSSVRINLNSIQAGTVTNTQSTICNGDTPLLITSVADAIADPGFGTLTYQWVTRSRPIGGPWGAWANAAGGSTSETYQSGALTQDTQFVRGATSTDGALSCSESTTIITILVNPAINNAVSTSSQTICSGETPTQLTFTGANTGPGYVNQWLESNDNIAFTAIPGAFGVAYSPPALASARFYRLQTTFTGGGISCTVTTTAGAGTIAISINQAPNSPNIVATSGTVTSTKQVTRVNINGTPATGDSYSVTLDGVLLTSVVASVGSTSLEVAQALDDIIAAEAAIESAITSGAAAAANIEITATTPGSTFTIQTSCSPCTSSSIGEQYILGSKKITFCLADLGTVSITASALGGPGITNDFFLDGTPIVDGPEGTILVPGTMSDTAVLTTRATTNTCSIEWITNLAVNRITGGVIAANQTTCSGEDLAPFTEVVPASGPPGSTILSYEWYIDTVKDGINNFTRIPGATGAVYDHGSLTASATFYRVPIIDFGGVLCNPPLAAGNASLATPDPNANRSNLIEITVSGALTAGVIDQADEVICMGVEGDPTAMTVSGGTPAGATIRFQWQRSTASVLGPFTDIPGVTTAGYDPPAGLGTSTWFRRKISQIDPFGAEKCFAFTNPRLVKVNTVTGGTISGTQTVCNGEIPPLFTSTVDATSNTGVPFDTGTITYLWQRSLDAGSTWNPAPGPNPNNLSTYQAPAITQSQRYRRLAFGTVSGVLCPTGTTTVTSNEIFITRTFNIDQPQLIRANYSGANTGNSGNNTENIIQRSGTTYNNSSCGTPLIDSFEACPVAGATGYEYELTDPTAGSINATTGVVSWSTTFTGSVTIRARALGCGGPSDWTETSFEITSTVSNASTPSLPVAFEEAQISRIRFSSTVTATTGDRWSIFIDGVEYTTYTTAGQTNAQVGLALVNLINNATGVADYVTASGSNPILLTADEIGRSFNVEIERNATSTGFWWMWDPWSANSASYCGPPSGAIPDCQITNTTPNTQFYSDSTGFASMTWDLEVVTVGPGSPALAGSITTDEGVVSWNPGFHGTVNVGVIAWGCDGNPSARSFSTVVIPPNDGLPSDITVLAGSSIPVCPATESQTTYFESSGSDVTWSWNNRAAGQIDAFTGQVTWTTGFSGDVTITATSMGCGNPSVSRKITIVSSAVVSLTSLAGTNNSQNICKGSPGLIPISYSILGAATTASITGLPDGFFGSYSPTTQTDRIILSGIAAADRYDASINGVTYSITVSNTDTLAAATVSLAALIQGNADIATATPNVGTDGVIEVTANLPNKFFYTSVLKEGAGNITSQNVTGTGLFTITGTPSSSVGILTRHDYRITTGGSTCTPTIIDGFFFQYPESQLILKTAGTDNQEICNNSPITDIFYKILGTNAASVTPLVNFDGLPPGMTPGANTAVTATRQKEKVTITGATATSSFSLIINGITKTSGVGGTNAGIAAELESAIDADAALSALVSTDDSAADGTLTIEALAPGVQFGITGSKLSGTGSITIINEEGISQIRIFGTPNVTSNSDVQYVYTLTTNANPGGCVPAATITGTIKVSPLETVTYDNTINLALYPGARTQTLCPSSTLEGISYRIGGAVGSVVVNGLPPGVSSTHSVTAQIDQFTITGVASTNIINLIVNGVSYSKTASNTDTDQTVAVAIATLIDNDTNATISTLTPGGGVIRLTADTPGVPFTSLGIATGGGAAINKTSVTSNVNNVVIEGAPNNTAIKGFPYNYTISTPGASFCNPGQNGGTITVAEGPKIELISASLTDSQEVCNGDNIVTIQYKVNGAGGAQIPALVPATFSGLPSNLFPGIFNATTQQDSITITGVAPGDEIKVYINGIEFSSGAASATSVAAVASVTAGINTSINPNIAGQVVAADLGGGVMTLTAVTSGSPFTLSVAATGGVAAITKSNQRGTGTFTISGQINQSHNTEMTYNYTITSLLNLNSCSAGTATGTIKIEPIETVTYDNTINPALFPGAATQELCPGTDMSGISFRIGGAVPSVVVAGLPPGVTSTHSVTAQQDQFTITGVASTNIINVLVNGVSYSKTATDTDTDQSVAEAISTLINNDTSATVSSSTPGGGVIRLLAETPGVPFSSSGIATGGGAAINKTSVVSNVNNVTLDGTPDNTAIVNKPYTYTITTPGTECASALGGGTITILEGPTLELISAALTDSQEVCNGSNIVTIEYKVTGAQGAQIPATVGFVGLPDTLAKNFNATTQLDSITVLNVNPGDEIKVFVNGIEFSSGAASATSAAAVASVTAGINASINPKIDGEVTATDLGGGVMTITADSAGIPFSLSVDSTGANITKSNQVGTGIYRISGQINQSHDFEATYNYEITTTNNIDSCNAATITGTIKIEPLESVTYDNTINNALFPGAATQELCPGTDMSGISFRIGGAVPSVLVAGLPPGVTSTHSVTAQQDQFTISGVASTNIVAIILNGVSYPRTANNSDTNQTVAEAISTLINNDPSATVSSSTPGGGVIRLIAETPGVPFGSSGTATGGGAAIVKVILQPNVNNLTIEGSPDNTAIVNKPYTYTITTPGTECSSAVGGGTITILEGPKLELTSAALTDNQEICFDDNIIDITYKVTGARGAQIPALNAATFTGLPANISKNFAARTQQDRITVTGVAPGDEIKIFINGVEFSSGAASATSLAAVASLTAGINASINPKVAGEVSPADLGGGIMTITADSSGIPFSLSVDATGGVAAVTKTNLEGTGIYTISGQIKQSHTTEMTYNYQITTTNNINSCTAATATGTIKIIPKEEITLDQLSDPISFGGPANQEVCENASIQGIRFNLTGGAYSASATIAIPPAINGLPPGVGINHVREKQVEEYTVAGIGATNVVNIIVNGISYSKIADGTDTVSSVIQTIANLINNDLNSSVTASRTAVNKILLTSKISGKPFTTSGTAFGGGSSITKTAIGVSPQNNNENYVTLVGGPTENVSSTKIYNYTLTTSGTSCTDDSYAGSITINPLSEISLISAGTTDNQIVCNGAVIDEIVYSISGSIANVNVSGLPGGVNGTWDAILRRFTIKGTIAASVASKTVFTYTVSPVSNDCSPEPVISGTIEVAPDITIDATAFTVSKTLLSATSSGTVSCFGSSNAAITVPDVAITGGVLSIAQVDRINISSSPGPAIEGDVAGVVIDGTVIALTVLDNTGSFGNGSPVESSSSIATRLSNKINTTPGISVTAQANGYGAGTIKITANTSGVGFTATVTRTLTGASSLTIARVADVANSTLTYTYEWSKDGAPGYSFSKNITGLSAGVYQLTVGTSLSGSCSTTSGGITIIEPDELTVSISGNCGASFTATTVGGTAPYIYTLVNNDDGTDDGGSAQTNSLTKDFNGVLGAKYVVKVKDANNCVAYSAVHTVFGSLTIDKSKYDIQNQRCFGRDEGAITKSTTVTQTVSGGSGFYSYTWTGPSGTFTTENISGLAAGDYQLSVVDLNYPSCTASATVTIRPATAITITPDSSNTTQMLCPVASDTVIGADWGTLTVSVTGGTIAPSYQYQWVKLPSGANISDSFGGNTNSVRINSGGDYMVIVSDSNAQVSTGNVSASTASCSISQLFSVTGPSENLSAEIVLGSNDKINGGNVEILFDTSSTTISCKGDSNGSFTFVIKGGTPPYEYKESSGGWTSAAGATVQLTGLSADTYNIRVRDAGQCVSGGQEGVTLSVTQSGTTTDNVGVIISEPSDELSASIDGTQQEIDCSTGIDGKITIKVLGGQAPYQLIWTGPAGSNYKALTSIDNIGGSSSIDNLTYAGDYSVTITDAAKCDLTKEFPLKEKAGSEEKLGKPTITVTPGACGTDEKPKMEGVLNGGTPLEIEWRKKDKAIVQKNMTIISTILVPQLGDAFTITINGVNFTETLTASPTKSSISSLTSALATKVDASAEVSAQAQDLDGDGNNDRIQIKALTLGLAFEYSDSVSRVTGSFSDIKDEVKENAQELVDGWFAQNGDPFGDNLIVDGPPAGLYVLYLTDASGCSPQTSDPVYVSGDNSSLEITVDTSTGGIEYFNTCSYSATPISANFKFNLLGATSLVSITLNGTEITQASGELAVASGGRYTVFDLSPGDYEITATDANNPGCPASQSITVNEATEIKYIGETELSIEKCQDTIALNFEPLTDFIEADNLDAFYTGNSDPYYALELSTPAGLVIKRSSFRTKEEIDTEINTFELEEGLYTLKITNSKGCTNDPSKPILINVTQEISNIVVTEGLVDSLGNPTFSTPVSCLLDAKDGKIGINIAGGPANAEINWEYLNPNDPLTTGYTLLPEYKGYLSMNDLEKGKYRYTITDPDPLITGNCKSKPYAYIQGVIDVEDDKSLVISDGPFVDNNLCNNTAGILRIDVIDSQQSPITFYYGTDFSTAKIVDHVKDDLDSYVVTIDNPQSLANLYVVNDRGCTKSVELNFELGTPGFEYSTPTYNNSISEDDRVINARQDITFTNQSTSPYTKVRWDWGDNVFDEIVIANSSIQTDPALQGDTDGDTWIDWVEFLAGGVSMLESNTLTPEDKDGDGEWDGQKGVLKGDKTHSYGLQGTYLVTLQIENELGCFDQVTKPVKVGKGFFVLPPNVFTPNGDKKNDYFGVLFSGFCYVEFTIYDNTGNVVYPTKSSGENPKISSSSTSTSTTSTLGYAPNFKRDEGGNFLGGPNETGPDGYPDFKPWDGKPEGSDELGVAPYYIWTLKAWNKESCTGEEFDAVVREGAFMILK